MYRHLCANVCVSQNIFITCPTCHILCAIHDHLNISNGVIYNQFYDFMILSTVIFLVPKCPQDQIFEMGFVLNIQCKVNVNQTIMLVGVIALGDKLLPLVSTSKIRQDRSKF